MEEIEIRGGESEWKVQRAGIDRYGLEAADEHEIMGVLEG